MIDTVNTEPSQIFHLNPCHCDWGPLGEGTLSVPGWTPLLMLSPWKGTPVPWPNATKNADGSLQQDTEKRKLGNIRISYNII